jgi:hypothetical protein
VVPLQASWQQAARLLFLASVQLPLCAALHGWTQLAVQADLSASQKLLLPSALQGGRLTSRLAASCVFALSGCC